jgi:hypothetical protein
VQGSWIGTDLVSALLRLPLLDFGGVALGIQTPGKSLISAISQAGTSALLPLDIAAPAGYFRAIATTFCWGLTMRSI